MPAPGDQYRDTPASVNPFNDTKPSISKYSAQEIATLQSRLEKQLGPEYISTRPGAGGGKVHYLAAEKVINLANEVFGFNGWSSSIQNVQIDFVDENPSTQRINLGLSTIVRVTLRDGAFHEDIGYGHCENVKGKAAAFEKAKKEAATDAMKRALRNFGNVLGNCLYDKDYLSRITKVKVQASKWDAGDLHRHRDFAPIKKEMVSDEQVPQNKGSAVQRNTSVQSNHSVGSFGSAEFEDDFGGNFFDDTDFSHPDEVRLDDTNMAGGAAGSEGQIDDPQQDNQRQAVSRTHSMPQMRPVNIQAPTPLQGMQAPQRPQGVQRPPANAAQGSSRMGPPQTPGAHQRHNQNQQQNRQQQQNNDGARSNPSSAGTTDSPSNKTAHRPPHDQTGQAPPARSNLAEDHAMPTYPPPGAPVGFVTGRKADLLNQPHEARPLDPNLAFNPHAESPSIRRTQGINPGKSAPISRQLLTAANGVPSSVTAVNPQPTGAGGYSNASGNGLNGAQRPTNSNFVNPSADMNRKIGMPTGGPGGFPNNRGAYKPHAGAKRPAMADVTNTHQPQTDGASDAKKQRVESALGENGNENNVAAG